MLLNLNDVLKNKAVPQFNFHNLEFLKAILEGAKEENYPVILGITEKTMDYLGDNFIKAIIYSIEKNYSELEIVIHLDHGRSLNSVMRAIRLGFTSVMIDGSALDFESNVSITKKVVEICKTLSISVEGELGKLEKTTDSLTDPHQAKKFVELTGVSALAVSIGTVHGAYKGKLKLDFERLKEINKLLEGTFLVLHGASSIYKDIVNGINQYGGSINTQESLTDDDYKKLISLGIKKINIDTDLRLTFLFGMRKFLYENKSETDPRKIMSYCIDQMKKIVKHKIEIFKI